jgi:hypothetical protein
MASDQNGRRCVPVHMNDGHRNSQRRGMRRQVDGRDLPLECSASITVSGDQRHRRENQPTAALEAVK